MFNASWHIFQFWFGVLNLKCRFSDRVLFTASQTKGFEAALKTARHNLVFQDASHAVNVRCFRPNHVGW